MTTTRPALLRSALGAEAWWWAGQAAAILPRSLALLARAGAPAATAPLRRAARRTGHDVGIPPTRAGALALAVLGVPVGLWAWAVVLLLVPNTLRNLAYPLANPTPAEYGTAWGGPTLAGAWAVHAGLAVALVPVWLAVLRGLAAVHVRLVARAGGARRARWAVPGAIGLALAFAVVGRAWWHQA